MALWITSPLIKTINKECLLSRVRGVGGGTEAARRRRQHAGYQEMRWARVRGAQEVGRRQGRLVVRSGHFLLD